MNLAEKLLDVYKENKIEETLKESDSWEMLYHLSPMRHNLLEWYEIRDNATILEIGAQAGAITGLFAERAKKVVALERDSELLKVNQEKNRGLSNIYYRVGNIDVIGEDERFDYITLIGTLENAMQYCVSNAPCEELFEFCKKHLKKDGILIIAGDNKTSMRCWAGAPENISGVPFAGITSNMKEKRCFSKIQYEKMLKSAGYEQLVFYYPTPDYRFPSSIFSDDFQPQPGELRPENGVYMPDGYQFFEEDLAYNMVCEDGQYPYFAESFLIFANNNK